MKISSKYFHRLSYGLNRPVFILLYNLLLIIVILALFWRNTSQTNAKNCKISEKQFKESPLAHRLLDGLKGIEIGGSALNPFCLNTLNVDFTTDVTVFKEKETELAGTNLTVDVIALGDALPFPDGSQDFVISSHVLEHFYDPIKAIKEWLRVVRSGGYVYMIVPHRDLVSDMKDKDRTTLKELIERHEKPSPPKVDDHAHYSYWIPQDLLELCRHFEWKVVEWQEVDDKVGNGFTIVIKKDRIVC